MDKEQQLAELHSRLAHKNIVTTRISETTRFVAFGIIAWVFAVHSTEKEFATQLISDFGLVINLAGVAAMTGVSLDYFQYIAAHSSVRFAINRPEANYQFNENQRGYRLQGLCFWGKQWAVGIAAILVATSFTLYVLF